MIEYRCFRNTDPPLMAALWQSQSPLRGLVGTVTPNFLAQHIFGKTYFDPRGLILGFLDGQLLGFGHAGFGATAAKDRLCHETGVISMLMTRQNPDESDVARGLLGECERYLRQRGAKSAVAIGHNSVCPFYLGLYGGARLPGVLADDTIALDAFRSAGYEFLDRTLIMHRDLEAGAIPIDRSHHLLRRRYDIDAAINPPDASWWEAITFDQFARMQFDLLERDTDTVCGQLLVWDMQPLANSWQITVAGMLDMNISEEHLNVDSLRFFVAEVTRYLHRRAISLLEVQYSDQDLRAAEVFTDLGFMQVDEAHVMRKSLTT